VSGFAERGEAEEGVDGGEAGVAAADAVPALAFEMVEEGADECGVEVGQIQLGGRFAEPGLARIRAAAGRCPGRPRWCAGWRGAG